MNKNATIRLAVLGLTLLPGAAVAQEADLAAQFADQAATTNFVFNTLLFLIGGFLVMWMAAGFAMFEAGLVRTKNVSAQCLKNIALYSVAGIMFWVIGYNMMYGGASPFLGGFGGPYSFTPEDVETGYSSYSDWFFQMVFCATTASIISGTVAERIKFWSFFIFVIFMTGFIYPIVGSWEWGGGFLDKMGFSDFAGSTLVHSTGGWAALVGAVIIGARTGKYGPDGKINPMTGSSIPLATLGAFILWLGWFGFNGGSQLAAGTISDADSVARIFVNTNSAAAAGVIAAIIYSQVRYGQIDVTLALNGALAGLVSITAEPLTPSVPAAIFVGATGSLIAMFTIPLLNRLKIDDVVGAIPVHLVAGIFGTLVVPLTNPDVNFIPQLVGVIAIGAFVSAVSAILWLALKQTIGLRLSSEVETEGLDTSFHKYQTRRRDWRPGGSVRKLR
ncbi:MAG: ammonium transporter [Hyphomonadaceae bacterium]|nr:ammonium transporter [Hyphomonadaceae bacterium]